MTMTASAFAGNSGTGWWNREFGWLPNVWKIGREGFAVFARLANSGRGIDFASTNTATPVATITHRQREIRPGQKQPDQKQDAP